MSAERTLAILSDGGGDGALTGAGGLSEELVEASFDPFSAVNLPNAPSYLAGYASSPFANAFIIPSDPASHYTPVQVTNNDGSPVVIAGASGVVSIVAPAALPPQFYAERGMIDSATNIYVPFIAAFAAQDAIGGSSLARFAIEAGLFVATPLHFFGLGTTLPVQLGLAPWDAQRFGSDFIQSFTPYASFAIGVYDAASGIPVAMSQRINDDVFADKIRLMGQAAVQGPPDAVYTHTPAVNVAAIQAGYEWFQMNYHQ